MSLNKHKAKIYLVIVSLLLGAIFFSTPLIRFFYSIESVSVPIITVNKGVGRKVQWKKFSVLVWNIFKGQRFPKHPLPFSPSDYDLALLQEDFFPKEKVRSDFFTKESWGFLMPTFKMNDLFHGTSLYSKVSPTQINGHQTPQTEPLVNTPKSYIVADFEGLRVINVHAINFVSFKTWKESMDEILEKTKDHSPLVLAGDFNTWNEERVEYLKKVIQQHDLQEVVFKDDHRISFHGFKVDYVFAKGLKLRSAEVMKLEQLSDHNPMEVIFEVVETDQLEDKN